MASDTTVVFADLTGSTGAFESLGNERAAKAVTRLTQWISGVCVEHGGRVVKTLGDGVLAVFSDRADSILAVVEMQRAHHKRISKWPDDLRMKLKIGMACGEVIDVDGDCYGDAVNVAARLSDLSEAGQIWSAASVVEAAETGWKGVRIRQLGPINVRGRVEPCVVCQIDWQEEVATSLLTTPGGFAGHPALDTTPAAGARMLLTWLDQRRALTQAEVPAHLGRSEAAQFVVSDQRVSRLHARLDFRQGSFILTDVSSFGTWIRFAGGQNEVALRREEIALHTSGEITLGAPFGDFTAPTVSFSLE